jgi:hypothetical protein
MKLSLPPCPACGGPRAFFQDRSLGISLDLWRNVFSGGLHVYGYTCVTCGHTTPRIHPKDLKSVRQAAETAGGTAPHLCPECQGPQVFLKWISPHNGDHFSLLKRKPIYWYACICLECGYTTKRPHPKDMDELRKAAEQGNTVGF